MSRVPRIDILPDQAGSSPGIRAASAKGEEQVILRRLRTHWGSGISFLTNDHRHRRLRWDLLEEAAGIRDEYRKNARK